MWNFIKNRISNKSASLKKEMRDIATIIEIFKKFERHDLVFWQKKTRFFLSKSLWLS